MRLPVFAGCLAMLVAAPAIAQTSPSAPAPAPDPLVERFLAALPHQEEYDRPIAADPERLARIGALNPGREQEVRTILTAEASCAEPASKAATRTTLRTVARNLGAEKLERLIAFYQGPDGKLVERISDTQDKGQAPSEADQKEMARIMAAYPLVDWVRGIQASFRTMQQDQAFTDTLLKCSAATDAAMARAKLRTQ